MNKLVRCITLIALFSLNTVWAFALDEIRWVASFETAMTESKRTNKLVMIDFFTDWCTWCKRLDKETYTDRRVIKIAEQFVAVKVDGEKEGVQIVKKYQVAAYPTILFINSGGGVEGKISGYLPPEMFAEQMIQIHSLVKELPLLEAQYRSTKELTTALKLATIYAGKGKLDRAEVLLATGEQIGKKSDDLAKAYNAIGDAYQMSRRFETAIPFFRKAAAASISGSPWAYARLSVAACLGSLKRYPEAMAEARVVEKMPNAPSDFRAQAKVMIEDLRKSMTKSQPNQSIQLRIP